MHQLTPKTSEPQVRRFIEERIQAYASEHSIPVGKVPSFAIAKELIGRKDLDESGTISREGWVQRVTEVREELVRRAALENERGQSFSLTTQPQSLSHSRELPSSSVITLPRSEETPKPKKKPKPVEPQALPIKVGGSKSSKFLEALEAMRSRLDGIAPQARSLEPLGLRIQDVDQNERGGRVLTNFPNVEPVGQGRVECHPFRWKALGIDPLKSGEEGTTLVIRTRHWNQKIEDEGATFRLSLVGGNAIALPISSVKPDQHAGVVIVNVSDKELAKLIGTEVGKNLNFQVEAFFTDKERPHGRHTQKCQFSIPTDKVAEVTRERVGWGEHETVEINLPRTDGVVTEIQRSVPEVQSMTTMMETECEFVLPPSYDMLTARRNLFALAMNPKLAKECLGEQYDVYPSDKYIEKSLKGITPEEYEKLPMQARPKFWKFGTDGLPKTVGHTDTIVDTGDRALLQAGLILRVRVNERGTVLSLKSVSQKGSNDHSRVRFCADVSLPRGTTKEDAIEVLKKLLTIRGEDPLDPNPFIQGLESAGITIGKGFDLRPTLEVSSSRDRVRVQDKRDSSNIELSLDRSTITPYSKEGRLEPEKAITSLGFEYGLEHAGVTPTDTHSEGQKPKKVVQGFRGFHVPSDLSHPSLHDPKSARNRALTEVTGDLTGAIFGDAKLTPGGFKAIEGAEHLGLIDGSWRKTVARREESSNVGSGEFEFRAPELPPHEQIVNDYVRQWGRLSIAQAKNLMRGRALGSLSIVAGSEERRQIAAWINSNPWVVPYMSERHMHQQLDRHGLDV